MLKKKKREGAEINGSSMADIAFLLLIFFLVTTTINVDTGIGMVLPPPLDPNVEPPPIRERNQMNILVNAQGLILMDEQPVSINEVREKLKEFIDNPNNDETLSVSPEAAIVSLKTQKETPYRIYIDMLDEVMGAYKELRDAASRANYGVDFNELKPDTPQRERIADMYPKKISIAAEEG
jgi:biopolymer transport protein ExbD